MSQESVARVRELYEAARKGRCDELHELVAPDATWEGAAGTKWKACDNSEDLIHTLVWRAAANRFRVGEVVDLGDRVVVSLGGRRMRQLGGGFWRSRLYQLVTVRGGKIVAMQDFSERGEALAAAGLTT
ncbi:MAG TPA: nuclear transport factor 2 family protein [Gaiellaceae bacterium]